MKQALVANAAQEVQGLIANPQTSSEDVWRFGVLQLLDDYESVLANQGIAAASKVFENPPALTGHSGLDASFAALACWLATRDGWSQPAWATAPNRVARPWWFVSESAHGKAWALVQSPGEFRLRGVFITDSALQRV